jgi:hypothetical protein
MVSRTTIEARDGICALRTKICKSMVVRHGRRRWALLLRLRAMIGWRELRLDIPISAMDIGVTTSKGPWVIACEATCRHDDVSAAER